MILAKRMKKASLFTMVMMLCGMMALHGLRPISAEGSPPTATPPSMASASQASPSATPRPTYNPAKPDVLQDKFLYADTAVLMEQHTGKILYDMRADKRMQPASITKTMTLLVALENGNLQDTVTVGKEILQIPGDSSKVPLIEGETVTLETLLYGLMIKSGNDAGMTIAVHIGGSVEGFVDMMNARAQELGCTGTHFMNPHGYEDKNHYTTALDMAKIAQEGMKNEAFRKIVGAPSFTIQPNNKRLESYTMKTKNRFVDHNENLEYSYPYGTGIKTGFFSAAQHTFIASATKDDVDLIAVVMKTTQKGKWIDAARLMDYGFATYCPYSVRELYETAPMYVDIENYDEDDPEAGRVKLEVRENENAPFQLGDTKGQAEKLKANFDAYCSYEGQATWTAPIEEGMKLGTLVFQPNAGEVYRYDLVASRTVKEQKKKRRTFFSPKENKPEEKAEEKRVTSAAAEENKQLLMILGGVAIALMLAVLVMILLIVCCRRKDRRNRQSY